MFRNWLIILLVLGLTVSKGVWASEELYGVDIYRNFREGLYSCYTSLTPNYRSIYNQHKFLRGGQYNVYWSHYETAKDQFNWDAPGKLKAELDSAKEIGLKTYLQIDAYGWDDEGALPKWMDREVQVIDISGRDDKSQYIFWNRFPAPWDTRYQARLRIFLEELRNKLRAEGAVKYISGIEMGTGPMAQTSFSWTSIQSELIRQSGVGNIGEFCSKYNDGIEKVIDIYADVFEEDDIPLVLIGGNCYGTNSFEKFKKYAFSKYGLRLQYKMAGFGGWGNDTSCGRRPEYKTICDASNCPVDYLHSGDDKPSAWCGQESGTSYNRWACQNFAQVFETVIREDNLTTTCLYSDDFKAGNAANFGIIKDFAGKLGAKVSFSNVNFPASVTVGANQNMEVTWKNEGSVSLVWPQRIANGDGSERERATSYKIFVVFVDRSDPANRNKWFSQYVIPNPGTQTVAWKQRQVNSSFKLDVPGLKQGSYDVYLGLGPQLSNEDIRIGRSGFGYALWNEGNWGRSTQAEGDNMYLIKSGVTVSGNDNRQKLTDPFSSTESCTKNSGDADGNGMVDMRDLMLWREEYLKKVGVRSDFDCDNRITMADFVIWRNQFLASR